MAQEERPATRRKTPWIVSALGVVVQLAIAGALIVGASLGAQRLIDTKPQLGRGEAREPVYVVAATETRVSTIRPSFEVFGAVEARRGVELRALVAGEVVEVSDDLIVGGRVKAGALLIQIDKFAYEGAVTEAEANLEEVRAQLVENQARLKNEVTAEQRAKEQLDIALRDLERAEDLARRGSGTRRSVDERRLTVSQRQQSYEAATSAIVTRKAQIDRLEASIKRLEWRLRQAERNLRDTTLKAPFDAVVRSENVEIGRNLSVNDVVAGLYAADALDVRFTVSDRQFGRLRDDAGGLLGREVFVSWAIGDRPVTATAVIDRVGSDVSATRGGVELIGRIAPADERLKPGAGVSVTVPDRAYENAARTPETAVFNGGHVFLITDDGSGVTRLKRQAVEALAWEDAGVILRADPPEALDGARVMTTRLAEAGDGVRVELARSGAEADGEEADGERADGAEADGAEAGGESDGGSAASR